MNDSATVSASDTANLTAPNGLHPLPSGGQSEETLVADARAGLTPSQFVERKLVALLRATPLPVSHLQTARATRR